MSETNSFPATDAARHEIWDMLVRRDIEAYAACDWDAHGRDFAPELFVGIDAQFSTDPDRWQVRFPEIGAYRDRWLASAQRLVGRIAPDALRQALFGLTSLREIEINGSFALARKRFDGSFTLDDGETVTNRWQTHYYCRHRDGRWQIAGFLGYLPNASASGSGQA
jgi:hypothetical protein